MIKVAAINYLNTVPFLYGLEASQSGLLGEMRLLTCTPSQGARMVASGEADLGIIPVGAIGDIRNPQIVSDYCIGSVGRVASVELCSPVEISSVKRIRMDVDSRTSVMLVRLLCREYWKIEPEFVPWDFAQDGISADEASLLIGDKALLNADSFSYVYDLASEWTAFKKMPFVFACWIAGRQISPLFLSKFNMALKYGIDHIEDAVRKYNSQFPLDYACRYLRENISFRLDADKRAGLTEYWRCALGKLNPRACL